MIAVDIGCFIVAFVALQFFIKIPESKSERTESILVLAKEGIGFLKNNPMIMMLILFMAGVNLVASAFDATLPGYVLPNPKGGQAVLGIVTSCSGVAMIIGWILVPIMSANLDVILRSTIPVELQGRVYACRNTLQFFTIPIGLFLGGFMVDNVCEPFMFAFGDLSILKTLFGTGKGSGAALMMFILGVGGSIICIITGKKLKKYQFSDK